MKLIFENWRRYLTEDASYFGDSFVQFKERVEAGEHPLKVARETLEYIGKGSTRIVFGFPDNSTQLLKVINVELIGDEEPYAADFRNPLTGFDRKHKTVSNENEADLKMQQNYRHVFPRTYEYADDYSWILAERVEPISSERLAEMLNIPPEFTRSENKKDYMTIINLAIQIIKNDLQINEGSTLAQDEEALAARVPMKNPLMVHAENLLKDKHNRLLMRAVAELKIPPRELSAKNLGISNFGGTPHLVILDASLWEYNKEEPPPPPSGEIGGDSFNTFY